MIQNIIVADDSATARMIIKRCLEIAGCSDAKFLDAKNGAEALELAKNNKVDLLVTDLNMPQMDGRSLLMHMKATPSLTNLPILVITSANNDVRSAELKGLGAFAVLNKPISPQEMAKALEPLSHKSKGAGND